MSASQGALGVPRWAALRPNSDAVVSLEGRQTFRDLFAQSSQGEKLLASLGVEERDRVGIAVRNRREYLHISMATWLRGAVLVPFAYHSTQDELEYLAEDAELTALFREADGAIPTKPIISMTWDEFSEQSAAFVPDEASVDAPAPQQRVLPYTSGTTGRPKALRRPNAEDGTIKHDPDAWLSQFPIASNEGVHLCVAPMYHAQPRLFTQAALDWGHRVVMMRRFDPEAALALIQQERVTWISMAPIHFVRILKLGREVIDGYDVSSVRFVVHSASPVAPAVKQEMMEIFPDSLWEMYGGTEGTFTIIGPDEWKAKPGSVGKTTPGRDLAILDENGNELPAGEVGMIYRHEPDAGQRFEYVGSPDATAAAWRGEYFTLGEVGYMDEDGYLFLTDRVKDMIVRGGVNVSSTEVEAVLIEHPNVLDVAVIGLPDDEYGETVLAAVVAPEGVSAQQLREFCQERLAAVKCPTRIEFLDELPREPTGKLRKRHLRDTYMKDGVDAR